MPDVEIDIDDLLDADSEEERASKLQVKSFQYIEFSDHGCLGLLGFQNLVGTQSPAFEQWRFARQRKSIGAGSSPSTACLITNQLLTADSFPGTFRGSTPEEAYSLGRESWLYLGKPISREGRSAMQAGEEERDCARSGK